MVTTARRPLALQRNIGARARRAYLVMFTTKFSSTRKVFWPSSSAYSFFGREAPAEVHPAGGGGFLQLKLKLAHERRKLHRLFVQRHTAGGRLAHFEQVFDKPFQSLAFSSPAWPHIPAAWPRPANRPSKKVHICDDGRKRRLQIVRDIGDKLCLHVLAAHFFPHGAGKPGLHGVQLFAQGVQDPTSSSRGASRLPCAMCCACASTVL